MAHRTAKLWELPEPLTEKINEDLKQFPKPIKQILSNRGFKDFQSSQQFLNADYALGDPFLLLGIEKANELIIDSIYQKKLIAVYGDYDVDGVTATALLVQVIHKLGGLVIPYIPNRFDEGYGLNKDALASLSSCGIDLVITVDCGIRSVSEARYAFENGLKLIITDHHHPRGDVPPANAVICPKQEKDEYPFKDLSGVGLAFKLAQALISQIQTSSINVDDWLDLVALGTIADMVPLISENRAMVRTGLWLLRNSRRVGIQALANVSGIQLDHLSSGDIGYMLGPRLNAAGRIESAHKALQLLLTEDQNTAKVLARELDNQNQQRQDLTKSILQQAKELIDDPEHAMILFAVNENFNEGIVGLVASRLTEEFYRPAIVGTRREDGTIRASCRSISGFHITEALDECAELLIQHGGHALAAGFTIRQENLDKFLECMMQIAQSKLGEKVLIPSLKADAEVILTELKPSLLDFIDQFEPTGVGNLSPLLYSKGVKVVSKPRSVGKDNNHLRLILSDGLFSFDAIAFRFGDLADKLPTEIDILFAFERNYYQGENRLQLRLIDLKPSSR